jgi:hypothetical protein
VGPRAASRYAARRGRFARRWRPALARAWRHGLLAPASRHAALAHAWRRRTLTRAVTVLLAVPVLLAGCGSAPLPPDLSASAAPSEPAQARAQLAALAAAAQDRHLVALYTLSTAGRTDRTVSVTVANDATWRVDIPGGALGGTADVSVAQTRDGLFQCALQSVQRPAPPTCVRVAAAGGNLPSTIDPWVQHLFTDWRSVLTDRQAPLAVAVSQPLTGARGTCFSVDSTSASLSAPLDVGIYCYDTDGTLTAARLSFGTLVLAGAPAAAPPTITLPGPVVAGAALATAAPPTPRSSGPPAGTGTG